MIYLQSIGNQQQMQNKGYDKDGDGRLDGSIVDRNDDRTGNKFSKSDSTKAQSAWEEAGKPEISGARVATPAEKQEKEDRIQDVAGALVGEYYRDSKGFAENHALVKEVQEELVKLGYNLGKTGKDKNGVDGDLGAKTILALHNFEQDHALEVVKAARTQAEIQKATIHKKDSPNR